VHAVLARERNADGAQLACELVGELVAARQHVGAGVVGARATIGCDLGLAAAAAAVRVLRALPYLTQSLEAGLGAWSLADDVRLKTARLVHRLLAGAASASRPVPEPGRAAAAPTFAPDAEARLCAYRRVADAFYEATHSDTLSISLHGRDEDRDARALLDTLLARARCGTPTIGGWTLRRDLTRAHVDALRHAALAGVRANVAELWPRR
jgi:hypothetical protein